MSFCHCTQATEASKPTVYYKHDCQHRNKNCEVNHRKEMSLKEINGFIHIKTNKVCQKHRR